jgi:hypothetical protein
LRQPRWITYTRAGHILNRLEELLLYPQTHRMPCALVVGETNPATLCYTSLISRKHR